jgi:hypothetical protein
MKTRTFQILNIIAIKLLLLALYLNFIHKDNDTVPSIPVKEATTKRTAAAPENNSPNTTILEPVSTVLN